MPTAIVLGAGMAGLLSARVLADHHDAVLVLDRDRLPQAATARSGVPQGRHAHGFLASGAQIVEQLFPGITADLAAAGVNVADKARCGRWFNRGAFTCRVDLGLGGFTGTRPLLEHHVRARVQALPEVRLQDDTQARGLVTDASGRRVTGVRVTPRSGGQERVVAADLVVDASGRGSRLPHWLEELGHERPREETVRVDLGYATRLFRRRPGDLGGDALVNVAAHPPNRRMGIAMAVEGDRWLVTLAGLLGDHPPLDDQGFLAFAAALPSPVIHDLVRDREPLTGAVRTRFPAHRRVRYEKLRRLPAGIVPLGDAVCSFNPVYGQGMSVAAKEAVLLGELLGEGAGDDLPLRFTRRAARLVDVPWDIAVGNDLRFAAVEGPRTARTRLVNRYMGRLLAAAAHDPEVALAFFRVGNLLAPPQTLLHPRVARRVLRNRLPAAQVASAGGHGTAADVGGAPARAA